MRLIDWNTAGPIFFASCDHCGERVGGLDLLTHDCRSKPAEFWRERYLIERRFALRMQALLALALVGLVVAGLCFAWRVP